jgi:hypothetical protein
MYQGQKISNVVGTYATKQPALILIMSEEFVAERFSSVFIAAAKFGRQIYLKAIARCKQL